MNKRLSESENTSTPETTSAFYFENQIDFGSTISAVKRFRSIFLGSILIGLVLSFAYFIVKAPVYSAEAVLFPNQNSMLKNQGLSDELGSIRNLISLGGGGDSSSDPVTSYLAILRSRSFIIPFLVDKGLVKQLANMHDEQRGDEASFKAYEKFIERHMDMERDRITGLISLRVQWHDSERAAAWTNELIRRLNLRIRQEYIDVAQRKIDYINGAVDDASVSERRALLFKLIEQEERKIVIAEGEDDFAFKVLDPAIAPVNPVHPKLVVLLPIGFALGALIGAALSVFAATRL